jgi:hypothetical protein
MKFAIGAMSVGDILDRSLKILLARLPTFYLIDLIVLSPMIAVQLAAPFVGEALAGGGDPGLAQVSALLVGQLFALILMLILGPIGQAATLHVITGEFLDRPASLGSAFSFALGRFLPLLGTSILFGLAVGFGFVACIVPCFFFWVWFIFSPQVVVVENRAGADALGRSKSLGEGFGGRIFGMIAIFFALLIVVNILVGILGILLPPQEVVPVDIPGTTARGSKIVFNYTNHIINTLVGLLVSILVQAYQAVCVTLLYFDLRIRKEGYDLELAAQQEMHPGS